MTLYKRSWDNGGQQISISMQNFLNAVKPISTDLLQNSIVQNTRDTNLGHISYLTITKYPKTYPCMYEMYLCENQRESQPCYYGTGTHYSKSHKCWCISDILTVFFQHVGEATNKESIKAPHFWPCVMGIHCWPLYVPQKGTVIHKAFPCNDADMLQCRTSGVICHEVTNWPRFVMGKTHRVCQQSCVLDPIVQSFSYYSNLHYGGNGFPSIWRKKKVSQVAKFQMIKHTHAEYKSLLLLLVFCSEYT